jgi:hypothetical protein
MSGFQYIRAYFAATPVETQGGNLYSQEAEGQINIPPEHKILHPYGGGLAGSFFLWHTVRRR